MHYGEDSLLDLTSEPGPANPTSVRYVCVLENPTVNRIEQAKSLTNSDDNSVADEESPIIVKGWRRIIYLGTSMAFFLLGAIGVMLPGLPATPFLLLTSYFLIRSSPRLNARLLRSRVFGPILTDWQIRGGVQRHIKVKAIVVVLISLALTLYFSRFSLAIKLAVVCLAIVGMTVVIRLPQPNPTQ